MRFYEGSTNGLVAFVFQKDSKCLHYSKESDLRPNTFKTYEDIFGVKVNETVILANHSLFNVFYKAVSNLLIFSPLQHIAICSETQIQLLNIKSQINDYTIANLSANPRGICALSAKSHYLAFPNAEDRGSVVIYDFSANKARSD